MKANYWSLIRKRI